MKQVFINLPVKDVQAAMKFYTGMGLSNNPQFSDEQGKCMVWSDAIFVMILSHEKFKSFISTPIADSHKQIAGLYALSVGSVDEMNRVADGALKAGGTEASGMIDYGFMQLRRIADPDGHTWEIFFMDLSKMPQN